MKLDAKLDAITLPNFKVGSREAEKAFARAIADGEEFMGHMRSGIKSYIHCCLNFYVARCGYERGEWGAQCELYKDKISERTLQRRVAFGERLIRWALYNFKDAKSVVAIREKFDELPVHSIRPIVEELRDGAVARKFGDYFADDYQDKKKARLLGQFEFDFVAVGKTLKTICDPKTPLPGDLEALIELEGALKSAAIRVAHRRKELEAK